MKKQLIKEKQLPISQKVKKMFRYSPSYQAQRCYSKLPLRQSHTSKNNDTHILRNNVTKIMRNSEINCEYSSVKQKNFDTNQCNDTSSWIAKLVNGIQEQDEENKLIHRLSQIQNNTDNDLPQDSQDYGYNEFLLQKGECLFKQKEVQPIKCAGIFEKETPVTKPMKKSIKQAMIEIQMKELSDGLIVPPVTRDSSFTKRENYSKIRNQNQNVSVKQKKTPNKVQTKKSLSKNKSQTSLRPKNTNTSTKNRNIQSKNRVKTTNKIYTKDSQSDTQNLSISQLKTTPYQRYSKQDTTIQIQTQKNSLISSGTKKQSIQRIRFQTQENPTRKNSFVDVSHLLVKDEMKIVDQHSKDLNIKNLFEEEKIVQTKPSSSQNLAYQAPSFSQKKIGGIKKNRIKNQKQHDVRKYFSQNDSIDKKYNLNIGTLNVESCSMQIESTRNPINFTLNRKNYEELMQVEPSSYRANSQRSNIIQNQLSSKRLPLKEKDINIIPRDCLNLNICQDDHQKQKNSKTQRQNLEKIKIIYDKIRLDKTNDILSRNNLKLRGLSEQEKTQLGSIITKIHYQNAQYDFQTFYKEYVKMNIQCSLKGCLSQQKLKKAAMNQVQYQSSSNVHQFNKLSTKNIQIQCTQKPKDLLRELQESYYSQKQQLYQIQSSKIQGIGHRRRNSNIVKKKLFQEIKKKSNMETALNQMNQSLRVSRQSDNSKVEIGEKLTKEILQSESQEMISKDPYINGPSLMDIQLTKRQIPSNRTAQTQKGIQIKKLDLRLLNKQNKEDENGVCLIEKLNKKLSTYIDKNQIISTYRQFNLNFSELKKHIR